MVEEAINHPDQALTGRFNRMVALKHRQEKTLKVVYEGNKEVLIVTAYWVRRERVA